MTSTNQKPPPRQFYRRLLPDTCISFCSDEGRAVFTEALHAGHMVGYFGLAAQFRTQDEPAYCGLSTLVMVLNTLEVDPQKIWRGGWRWYHEAMLDCCVPLPIVKEKGINFDQFACLAACNTLNVKVTRATQCASEEELRNAVRETSRGTDRVIVATYSRKVFKQTGDGHFSPIGGYHPGRDLVLILDTARFKYPPHWVPLASLWEAMQAVDKDTGLSRGYFELSHSKMSPLVFFRVSSALTLQLCCLSCNTVDNRMQVFLDTWSAWLSSPREEGSPDIEVIALDALIQALAVQPEPVLTTQINVKSTVTTSSEHCCVAMEIMSAIEKLPLFDLVKDNVDGNTYAFSGASENTSGDAGICADAQCRLGSITQAHFVTMLLLSWPKTGCGASCEWRSGGGEGVLGRENGRALQGYVDELLGRSAEILRYEVDQLQQQLALLMTYRRQCCCRNAHKPVE